MDELHQRLGDVLIQAPAIHDRLLDLGELGPKPGSNALTDLQASRGELVRSGAIASINSSIDHVVSWAGLFIRAGMLPSFAHYTLLRSAAEGASSARWLVDPTVDRNERVARGMGHQLADLIERRKLEQIAIPTGTAESLIRATEGRLADERIEELRRDAGAAGLTPVHITRTDLVARFGVGEFAYRILCAFAHAGLAIPFAASTRTEPREPDAGGLRAVTLTGDIEGAILMSGSVVSLVWHALGEVYAYQGYPIDPTPPAAG